MNRAVGKAGLSVEKRGCCDTAKWPSPRQSHTDEGPIDRPSTRRKINRLIESVSRLRQQCLAFEQTNGAAVAAVATGYRQSARNLLHYLALRQHDIRGLQEDLSSQGLSSLGRLEAHTMATLDAVLKTLHRLADEPPPEIGKDDAPVDFDSGPKLLREHAEQLLGPAPADHPVRVMVTMPTEAACDPDLVRNLLGAGMNIMRINCAHDGPEAWAGMVANLRAAEQTLGRSCRVMADLSGPKLRTGGIAPLGCVVKFKPRRTCNGNVLQPVRIWLTPVEAPSKAPDDITEHLFVQGDLLVHVRPGYTVGIEECRGRKRDLAVTEVQDGSCCVVSDRTLYVAEGAALMLWDNDGCYKARGRVVSVPPAEEPLLLRCGDTLVLTRGPAPGYPARLDANSRVLVPAHIPCSLGAVFESVNPGEQVWMNDGKIGGVLRAVSANEIAIEITYAGPKGSKLRAEKGINLPDTVLDIPAMSEKDFADLDAIFPLIDMVSLSFVHRPEDIYALERRLDDLDGQHLGVVVKIENRAAFERLPELLLAALRSPPVGVMVARGDLAVEVGFDRLAEVQEQILWLCEAAHVPVIWATQVLEEMAKTGRPSRSEVTDAAMSGRAECVMLNKGPHIVEAVEFLSGVLKRMDEHQSKKTATLRRLHVSEMGQCC